METAHNIVVCGHLCLDIIPGFPPVKGAQDWFRPGRLSIVGAPVISTGGAVSNVGLGLHSLGLPVRLAARIGDDAIGKLVWDRVTASGAGLAEGIRRVKGEVTSYTVVLNPPGIDRVFFHCPGANDTFTDEDVTDQVLAGAALLHFGYPPLMQRIWSDGGMALRRLLTRARAHGARTSLDMSLPDPKSPSGQIDWNAFLARVLPYVDFFVPSVEELLFMIDRQRYESLGARGGGESIIRDVSFSDLGRLAEAVLTQGASTVLIKLGDRGAYLRTGSSGPEGLAGWKARELYAPVFSVPAPAGTAGAGDATIAGFLASIYKCFSPEDALTMAVAVGGSCVEAPDAVSGIKSWDETLRRVREGWPRASVPMEEPGWQRDGKDIWHGPSDQRPLSSPNRI
jgi:sugar/nucleoside kinase (ribokinase family)